MMLKGHKNSIASGATAANLPSWRVSAAGSFGLTPNTPAISFMLRGRDQFANIIECLGVDYSLRKQH
jgi:hypothetical protein